MTEQKKEIYRKEPKQDELIKNLVPDPSQVPNLKRRDGWLGKSSRKDYWRLYLTPELNNYLEFREEDAVHTLSLESDLNPFGGTSVFLKREAELLHTRTTSSQAQAEWLSGDITMEHLRRTGAAGMFTLGGGGPQPFWWIPILTVALLALLIWQTVAQCPDN